MITKTPDQKGREAAARTHIAFVAGASERSKNAARQVCLEQLVALIATRGLVTAQDALDILVQASDQIQRRPDSDDAVREVEKICRYLAESAAAKRLTA